MNTLFVYGAPASGKTTLCCHLSEQHNFKIISAGVLLRRIATDPRHVDILRIMQRGEKVPTQFVISLIQHELPRNQTRLAFDNFPQDNEGVEFIEKYLRETGRMARDTAIVDLHVNPIVLLYRFFRRRRPDASLLSLGNRYLRYRKVKDAIFKRWGSTLPILRLTNFGQIDLHL